MGNKRVEFSTEGEVGDLGYYNDNASIKPVEDGEDVTEEITNRAIYNLRQRTDQLRFYAEELKALIDSNLGLVMMTSPSNKMRFVPAGGGKIEFSGSSDTPIFLGAAHVSSVVRAYASVESASTESYLELKSSSFSYGASDFTGQNRVTLFIKSSFEAGTNVSVTTKGGLALWDPTVNPPEYTTPATLEVVVDTNATLSDLKNALDSYLSTVSEATRPFTVSIEGDSSSLVDTPQKIQLQSRSINKMFFTSEVIESFFETHALGEEFGVSLQDFRLRGSEEGLLTNDFYSTAIEEHNQTRGLKERIPLFIRLPTNPNAAAFCVLTGQLLPPNQWVTVGGEGDVLAQLNESTGTGLIGFGTLNADTGDTDDYGGTPYTVDEDNLHDALLEMMKTIKGRLGLSGGSITGSLDIGGYVSAEGHLSAKGLTSVVPLGNAIAGVVTGSNGRGGHFEGHGDSAGVYGKGGSDNGTGGIFQAGYTSGGEVTTGVRGTGAGPSGRGGVFRGTGDGPGALCMGGDVFDGTGPGVHGIGGSAGGDGGRFEGTEGKYGIQAIGGSGTINGSTTTGIGAYFEGGVADVTSKVSPPIKLGLINHDHVVSNDLAYLGCLQIVEINPATAELRVCVFEGGAPVWKRVALESIT